MDIYEQYQYLFGLQKVRYLELFLFQSILSNFFTLVIHNKSNISNYNRDKSTVCSQDSLGDSFRLALMQKAKIGKCFIN